MVEYIPLMIDSWHAGYDIVIMKREKHAQFFREWSSALFYKLLNKLSRTPIYFRFSGFLLINRKAANSLKMFCEREPFFRGLIGLIGFKKTEVYYKENQRMSGETKFRLFESLKLVISAFTSFSEVPAWRWVGYPNPQTQFEGASCPRGRLYSPILFCRIPKGTEKRYSICR